MIRNLHMGVQRLGGTFEATQTSTFAPICVGDRDIHLEYATIASDDVTAPLLVFLQKA